MIQLLTIVDTETTTWIVAILRERAKVRASNGSVWAVLGDLADELEADHG